MIGDLPGFGGLRRRALSPDKAAASSARTPRVEGRGLGGRPPCGARAGGTGGGHPGGPPPQASVTRRQEGGEHPESWDAPPFLGDMPPVASAGRWAQPRAPGRRRKGRGVKAGGEQASTWARGSGQRRGASLAPSPGRARPSEDARGWRIRQEEGCARNGGSPGPPPRESCPPGWRNQPLLQESGPLYK